MPDDSLSAALDAIRERTDRPVAHVTSLPISHEGVRGFMESAADVPRLLAFADAAVKLAADWKQEAARLDAKADRAQDSASSSLLSVRAQGCDDHSRALTEAITRELLGGPDAEA